MLKLIDRKHDIALFEGRKPNMHSMTSFLTPSIRDRRPDLTWTVQEDNLLKELADRYMNNWRLIADTFNSSRITLPSDKRSPLECHDRWRTRWTPMSRQNFPTPMDLSGNSSLRIQTSSSQPGQAGQMTTRGVKRSAAAAAMSTNSSNSLSMNTPTTSDRKRRRHNILNESMRKASKKREMTLKQNSMYHS